MLHREDSNQNCLPSLNKVRRGKIRRETCLTVMGVAVSILVECLQRLGLASFVAAALSGPSWFFCSTSSIQVGGIGRVTWKAVAEFCHIFTVFALLLC